MTTGTAHEGIEEGLALLGYGALGAIVVLWTFGQVDAEQVGLAWRLHPADGAALTIYSLVAVSVLALWGRCLFILRRRRST
jgi:hypothetical protein